MPANYEGGQPPQVAGGGPSGLPVLRRLREWEHGRVCPEAWGPTRSYLPSEWATMKDVGYVGAEDEEMFGAMVGRGMAAKGGGWGGGSGTTKAPAPNPTGPSPKLKSPPPPQKLPPQGEPGGCQSNP